MFTEAKDYQAKKKTQSSTYLSLQPSEKSILDAASRIYAAYISSNQVVQGQEKDYMRRAIHEAVALAHYIEDAVLSDTEI